MRRSIAEEIIMSRIVDVTQSRTFRCVFGQLTKLICLVVELKMGSVQQLQLLQL
jgi:hypothetical protein